MSIQNQKYLMVMTTMIIPLFILMAIFQVNLG